MAEDKNKTGAVGAAPSTGKLKAADKPEEGTTVKLKDKMWIKGTGKSKHLPEGSIHEVNPIAGEKLISKGAAVETTAPKPKAAPKKADKKEDEDED
jgi:hypothetical protein